MRKISVSVIALAIVAIIFIAGEAYAYLPQDRGFSSDVYVDGTINYSIGAQGAYVGSAALIDNVDLLPVKELYIYRDASYRSDVNEKNITAVGSQVFTQDYYIDQLTKNVRYRGITDIKMLNADELKEQLQTDIGLPKVEQKGLVIISGAVPETVFSGSPSILENWIDKGGFLYWAGNVIGRTMSTHDDIVVVDKQNDLVGTWSFCGGVPAATYDTEYRSKMCFENQKLEFSPEISSSDSLKTGISDDGTHYTVTFIKKGSGQICICSGQFNSLQIHDMATSIASGLTYKTQIEDFQENEFNRSTSGSFDEPAVHGNLCVYISIGKYHCAYAQRYDL